MNNFRSNKAYSFLNANIWVENVISLVLFLWFCIYNYLHKKDLDKYRYKNIVIFVASLARQYLYSQELCEEVQCLTFAA